MIVSIVYLLGKFTMLDGCRIWVGDAHSTIAPDFYSDSDFELSHCDICLDRFANRLKRDDILQSSKSYFSLNKSRGHR